MHLNLPYKTFFIRLRAADHIAAYRPYCHPMPVYHHAIYMGDNTVIEFNDTGCQQMSYADFKSGCFVYAIYHKASRPTEEILQNARDALNQYRKEYHLFWNNCETFVTEIVTGEGFSTQTKHLTYASRSIGAVLGFLVIGLGVLVGRG